MIRLESINIHHHDYLYKCNRSLCYICNRPVKKYKPIYCKCKDINCEIGKKPANIPICKKCLNRWLYSQMNKGRKTRRRVVSDRLTERKKRR